jgi:hypothetical protein
MSTAGISEKAYHTLIIKFHIKRLTAMLYVIFTK